MTPRVFRLSKWENSPAPQFKGTNSLVLCLPYSPALTTTCDHRADHSLDYTDLCRQSEVSALQHVSSFVIAFLPRSNRFLISWLQSPSAVILEPKKRKSVTISIFSPSICHAVVGPDAMIITFLLSRLYHSPPSLSSSLFSSSSLSAIRGVSSTFLRLLMFLLPILILACNSSSPAFLMICSVYRLNRMTADSPDILFFQY